MACLLLIIFRIRMSDVLGKAVVLLLGFRKTQVALFTINADMSIFKTMNCTKQIILYGAVKMEVS